MQKVHFSTTPRPRGRLPRTCISGFTSSAGRCGSLQLKWRAPYGQAAMQARHDQIVRGHNLDEIRRLRPDVRVRQLDTMHFLLQLEPRRTAEAIVSFLAELPA